MNADDGMSSAEFLQSMGTDAQLWARAFLKLWGDRKEQIDESLMIGWFANAIMCGWDHRGWSLEKGEGD